MTDQLDFSGEKAVARATAILETVEPNSETSITLGIDEGEPKNHGGTETASSEQNTHGTDRKLCEIKHGTTHHDVLAYIDSTPGSTSNEIDDDQAYDLSHGSITAALSDLWQRRLVERVGKKPYRYTVSTHGKAELERLERVDDQ